MEVHKISNQLKITTQGNYKNINLDEMGSGDTITFKKLSDAVKRADKVGNKWNPDKKWVSCMTTVEYNNEKVGFFLPKGWTSTGYVENTDYSDALDKLGPEGTMVELSVVKGIGKDKKGKEIVTKDFKFAKYNGVI